jgi:hypothetical protein
MLSIFLKIRTESELCKLPLVSKLRYMDPIGCIVFICDMCCLLLALQWGGQTKAWNSATIIGLLVGSAALSALFILIQWKLQDRALIPPRVFRRRSIWTGALVLCFLGGSTYLVTCTTFRTRSIPQLTDSRLYSSFQSTSKPLTVSAQSTAE